MVDVQCTAMNGRENREKINLNHCFGDFFPFHGIPLLWAAGGYHTKPTGQNFRRAFGVRDRRLIQGTFRLMGNGCCGRIFEGLGEDTAASVGNISWRGEGRSGQKRATKLLPQGRPAPPREQRTPLTSLLHAGGEWLESSSVLRPKIVHATWIIRESNSLEAS